MPSTVRLTSVLMGFQHKRELVELPPQIRAVAACPIHDVGSEGLALEGLVRRLVPKTVKKASQKLLASASSRVTPAQSLANATALWRISFQEIGMDADGTATPIV